jgi:VIT1/CCC1 family predicted Fe2+/Mn2+ transporter
MVATLAGKTRGGTAYSLFYFSHDGLGAVSPLLAAVLIESLGIVSPFVLAIILLIVGVVLARLMSPLKKCTG